MRMVMGFRREKQKRDILNNAAVYGAKFKIK